MNEMKAISLKHHTLTIKDYFVFKSSKVMDFNNNVCVHSIWDSRT